MVAVPGRPVLGRCLRPLRQCRFTRNRRASVRQHTVTDKAGQGAGIRGRAALGNRSRTRRRNPSPAGKTHPAPPCRRSKRSRTTTARPSQWGPLRPRPTLILRSRPGLFFRVRPSRRRAWEVRRTSAWCRARARRLCPKAHPSRASPSPPGRSPAVRPTLRRALAQAKKPAS